MKTIDKKTYTTELQSFTRILAALLTSRRFEGKPGLAMDIAYLLWDEARCRVFNALLAEKKLR
jgi:hypothetical protein